MSDQDRGAYTPQTDAPLSFDARFSQGAGERPMPTTLIISGVLLVALVVAMVLFYRHGVRETGQPPQVVGTPVADTKAPPSAQAPTSDSAAGLQVYKAEVIPPAETRSSATLAPPPEAPAPRPAAAMPTDGANLRPAQPETAPQPAPQVTAAAPPKPVVAAASAPSASPAAGVVKPAPAKPAAVKLAVAKPAVAKRPIAKPVVSEIPTGAPVAQIGAFSSATLADKGWSDVAAIMPGQMSGKSKKVELASKDGKSFYRTFVGGFATKADAQSFCASLQAAGRGCIVK
jgi:hypothetical protein